MILNYWVIVERYLFPNGVIGGSILAVKSSLYLMGKLKKNKKKKKLGKQEANGLKFTLDYMTLVIYLFIDQKSPQT